MVLSEEAHIHVDVISDFWVFRPTVGKHLKGVVNKKSASHISCLVHGCFNVSCYRPQNTLVKDWCGAKAKLHQVIQFVVIKTDLSQQIPYILGSVSEESFTSVNPAVAESLEAVVEVSSAKWEKLVAVKKNIEDNRVGTRLLEKSDSDSGIDSTGKRKRENEETGLPSSPKKKKKKREHQELQDSLLSSVESKFEVSAKKKKKKKDKEKDKEEKPVKPKLTLASPIEKSKKKSKKDPIQASPTSKTISKLEQKEAKSAAVEADAMQNSLLSAVQSEFGSEKKRKKRKKETMTKESVPSTSPTAKSPVQSLPKGGAKREFKSPAIVPSDSDSSDDDDHDKRQSLIQSMLSKGPAKTPEAKTNTPKVKSEPITPQSSLVKKSRSKKFQEVPKPIPKMKPFSPKKPAKSPKKTPLKKAEQDKAAQLLQDTLIKNMLTNLPGSGKKRKN